MNTTRIEEEIMSLYYLFVGMGYTYTKKREDRINDFLKMCEDVVKKNFKE